MKKEIQVRGNYIYINDAVIQFANDEEARQFLVKLIKEGVL
jgi:hypothetical protein